MAQRRCSFWFSNNRQCTQPGRGNPPVCSSHDFAVEDGGIDEDEDEDQRWADDPVLGAVVDRIMDHPAARDLFGRVSGVIDQFGNVIDQMSGAAPAPKWARPRAAPQPPPRRAAPPPPPRRPVPPPPPPPPPPPRATGPDPRRVLGIPPGAVLTRRLIKDRQRALAMKHHPDRGGSTAAMQKINDAATELLKQAVG